MNTIYIYTTEYNRSLGRYKIGESRKQTAKKRIGQQKTGSSEEFITIFECETTLSDHEVRQSLRLLGYHKVTREWVGGFKSDDEVVASVSKIISESGSDTRVEFKTRFFQSFVSDLFLNKYNSEIQSGYKKIDFALELAPRFGKTLWSLNLIKNLYLEKGIKVCIIPSYVLTAISSFEVDFYKFKGFSDSMVFVDDITDLEESINDYYGDKMIVVAASLHMTEHQSKLETLRNIPSNEKMSIIDEADFGAHRINSLDKIEYLDCHLNIYMSGTGLEKVSAPLTNLRDNIIHWSYTDMLMVKNGLHPSQANLSNKTESISSVSGIVTPQFLKLSIGGIIDRFNSIPEEYRTDWNKLLMDVSKSKGILTDLIKSLFGAYNGRMTYLVDLNTDELSPKDVTMIFASTPNRKEQNKFYKLVQDTLGPQYMVKLFNSDETSNRESEKEAKEIVAIAKRQGKKVVFISKDMASRSFSIPEIDTVMLMFDRGSYSSVAQKVSRVLTPGLTYNGEPKTIGNVISLSLDPNREEISPIDEYLVYEGERVQVQELTDGILRVLRSVNIFVNDNGVMSPIVLDEYADKLVNSTSLIRIGSESVNVDSVINDSEMVKVLTGVEISDNSSKDKIEGIDSSKVKRSVDEETENNSSQNTVVIDNLRIKLKEVLSNIVKNIVEISEINNCESNNIIEVLDMIEDKKLGEELIYEVGVNSYTVKKLILGGALSEKLLNTIITSYNKQENTLSL
jgi:hypothetical protein